MRAGSISGAFPDFVQILMVVPQYSVDVRPFVLQHGQYPFSVKSLIAYYYQSVIRVVLPVASAVMVFASESAVYDGDRITPRLLPAVGNIKTFAEFGELIVHVLQYFVLIPGHVYFHPDPEPVFRGRFRGEFL